MDVVGNFNLALQPGMAKNKKLAMMKSYFKGLPGSAFSPFGSSGGKNGIGGSLLLKFLFSDVSAEVGNGTKVYIGQNGKLSVNANTELVNFSLVQAGSSASGGFAVAGAVSFVGMFSTTVARLANTAVITSGTGGTGGDVEVKAARMTP